MVIVGVGVTAKPETPFATDMKIALAVALATASDCISMAGLTAAIAAAAAAASNCSFLRSAWLKSSVMPSRKMMGISVIAAITATFALRSLAKRYNQARSIIFILVAEGSSSAILWYVKGSDGKRRLNNLRSLCRQEL